MSNVKLSDYRINQTNPVMIRDERFAKLQESILEFPKMMELRPIIHDETKMIIGGNQRFAAIIANGMEEAPEGWFRLASDLTEEEIERLIIMDNERFGEDDWNILKDDWDLGVLKEWGKEIDEPDKVSFTPSKKKGTTVKVFCKSKEEAQDLSIELKGRYETKVV